jgi:hypothetical protein
MKLPDSFYRNKDVVLIARSLLGKVLVTSFDGVLTSGIITETEAYAGTTTDPDNGYDQFTWLRQSLENSKAAWKVVTGHHPVYASGRWSDRQPDDHMSLSYMQRLLKALPEGSFDAYYNGHDHYYERVIEGAAGGIGLGIPFITNGNSGRNLSKKIQVPYGTSIYNPSAWDKANKKVEKPEENPNEPLTIYPFDAAPLEVASSALAGGVNGETNNFQNGLYGYGFGATKLEVEEGYLLFKYEEAPFSDPAIANHLAEGVAPDLGSGTDGIASTRAEDWIPDPNGSFKGKLDERTLSGNHVDNCPISPGLAKITWV